jgi:hypothetical protein
VSESAFSQNSTISPDSTNHAQTATSASIEVALETVLIADDCFHTQTAQMCFLTEGEWNVPRAQTYFCPAEDRTCYEAAEDRTLGSCRNEDHMRIKAKELFKHDIKTYQAGKVYEIEQGLGKYFVANGWATEMGTKETPRKSGKE